MPGDDAALKSLNVDKGLLSPAFSKSCFAYSVSVRNEADEITVSAAASSGKAAVSGTGRKTLKEGDNFFTVEVSTESGVRGAYTITVRRLEDIVRQVSSAADLAKIGVEAGWDLAGEYALINNITVENWTGIAAAGKAFSGVFDGGGNTITLNGLNVSDNVLTQLGANALAGIFTRVEGSSGLRAAVKNLTIIANVDIDEALVSHLSAGIVAGYTKNADFDKIKIQGNVSVKNTGVKRRLIFGGIAGIADNATISECTNKAEIYAFGTGASGVYNQAGGIAGLFLGGTAIAKCRNTGKVTGVTAGDGSNVFAGGIAGGTPFAFSSSAPYYGKIEDSSSTADVRAEGGGYWSWAGGIAGTVAGRSGAEPSRISCCNASGNISVKGPRGSWPYIGGITAANTAGALVEQCFFSGKVTVEREGSDRVSDYSGGIAGYNHNINSTIQDCWSSGMVEGFLNAGGIAGQNQSRAVIRRCFSTAAIVVNAGPNTAASSANMGAGGIAGFSVSAEADGLADCVALNASVSAPGGFTASGGITAVGRVAGMITPLYIAEGSASNTGILKDNYARSDMSVTVSGADKTVTQNKNGPDGADCAVKPDEFFYGTLGWNFSTVWKMGGDGYPALKWQP